MQRRYDGIMTNNLIEHLTDPVDAFRLFRSLLSGPYSLMAHSTPCYEYSFEYTRFHLFFFTGSSIDVLCKKCGLNVETVERDPDHDFINYVYSIAEKDCMDRMHTMHHCEFIDDHGKKAIVAYPGGIIYGPYVNLLKGSYKMEMMCEFKGNPGNMELAITKNSGQLIENHTLQSGFNIITFDLVDYARDIEFVVRNDGMDYFKLTSAVLKR
jgi:hypothetical protein